MFSYNCVMNMIKFTAFYQQWNRNKNFIGMKELKAYTPTLLWLQYNLYFYCWVHIQSALNASYLLLWYMKSERLGEQLLKKQPSGIFYMVELCTVLNLSHKPCNEILLTILVSKISSIPQQTLWKYTLPSTMLRLGVPDPHLVQNPYYMPPEYNYEA